MKYQGEKLGKDQVTKKRKIEGLLERAAKKHEKKHPENLSQETNKEIVNRAKKELDKEIK